MTPSSRLSLAWLAFRELGFRQMLYYARYQFGIRTGHYRRQLTHAEKSINLPGPALHFQPGLNLPDRETVVNSLSPAEVVRCLAEADEILNGQVRLFGGDPVELQLAPTGPLPDWTDYELGKATGMGAIDPADPESTSNDIKLTWEPARFGWAYILGRAYRLSGDERYPAGLWQLTETFLRANPTYQGPNWISAQEAALRILAFAFSGQVFSGSVHTTPERSKLLAQAIAAHALRIPPTLVYARAQNNNHLLSEAVGLYTAGVVLPQHPGAAEWRKLGWRWFNHGVQTQIDPDGAYSQHSTNYQRLMLQLALWMNALARNQGQSLPERTLDRLASATRWLLSLVDSASGRLPNLGPNDGALIQPLSACPFWDYRPVLQAASRAFLGQPAFPPGAWDESSHWLGQTQSKGDLFQPTNAVTDGTPHILRSPDKRSWAYLRIARFHSRPGHADQLHLDLWWRGLNVAQDAGTYRYNAPPPWDNALAHSAIHNTITINSQQQMQRAGRFLFLRWAQAYQTSSASGENDIARRDSTSVQRLYAWHDGYRQFGIHHQRCVTVTNQSDWFVEDSLLPVGRKPLPAAQAFLVRLNWLLPDWPWELKGANLRLQDPLRVDAGSYNHRSCRNCRRSTGPH